MTSAWKQGNIENRPVLGCIENEIMTLQEKIQKKAEGYGQLAPAFLEGAKFALENQWISVEDDLPCNHEELIDPNNPDFTVFVLVRWLDDGFILSARMIKCLMGEWEWELIGGIGHWMPIPELPKEQED